MIRIAAILILLCSGAWAEEPKTVTSFPIPRFVSLKSNEVNARTGPGANYPIKWVYSQKGLPVEVVAEFGNWRKVKDIEGEEGWVLQSLVSGIRTAITKAELVAYAHDDSNRAVLRLSSKVQVVVLKCEDKACEISFGKIKGWVDKSKLWGVYGNEQFD